MIGNLVVGAVVVLLIVAAVACLIRQKRKGIGCCGCSGCRGCRKNCNEECDCQEKKD